MRRQTFPFAARRLTAAALVLVAATALAAARAPEPLASRIGRILDAPAFSPIRWGVQVVALDTGETLYSRDANHRFTPASNLKLYSTSLALARLGPEYRWRTSVYGVRRPDAKGRLAGDLVVYGRGDPTISAKFSGGDPIAKIETLADRIAAAGVRQVTGDIVADESYFKGVRFGYGWEWNDLQWGFGAEVSALSVADNVVYVEITPGAKPGAPCTITTTPATSYVRVTNRTRTSPKGGVSDLGIYRAEGSNVVDIWGHVPFGSATFTTDLAVHNPAGLFATLMRDALERRKITVAGTVKVVDARARESQPFAPETAVELASLESEPLADVVRETNKESQNLYAELLLRSVGRSQGPADAVSAESGGTTVLMEFLKSAGIDTSALAIEDGSGLSRGNYVTPAATVGLLAYVRKQPYADTLFTSLPEAGADGTLGSRFKNTPATGRVRAKTGTLGDAAALAGYLTTRTGRPVAFSIMANNAPNETKALRQAIDAVVLQIIDD